MKFSVIFCLLFSIAVFAQKKPDSSVISKLQNQNPIVNVNTLTNNNSLYKILAVKPDTSKYNMPNMKVETSNLLALQNIEKGKNILSPNVNLRKKLPLEAE